MTLVRLTLALAFILCSAHAFHIEKVEFPKDIDSETEVTVTVTVKTPSGTQVYQPTQIIRDKDEVLLLIFPMIGISGMIGEFTETHQLGKLEAGNTKLTIVLVPNSIANWGDKTFSHMMTVQPKLRVMQTDVGTLLLGPQTAQPFILEYKPFSETTESWNLVEATSEDDWGDVHRWFLDGWSTSAMFRMRSKEGGIGN